MDGRYYNRQFHAQYPNPRLNNNNEWTLNSQESSSPLSVPIEQRNIPCIRLGGPAKSVRVEVELSARLPLKSSDDVEACIGMNTLSSSPEKENENEGEREQVRLSE